MARPEPISAGPAAGSGPQAGEPVDGASNGAAATVTPGQTAASGEDRAGVEAWNSLEFETFSEVAKQAEKEQWNPRDAVLKAQRGEPGKPLAALCFSGGGIRSATFNLGVIQRLARQGLLDQFDYLSTVSGGGYIGGWLMAWGRRTEGGLPKVIAQLNGATGFEPGEPAELRHLRDFSRYLSPRASLTSVDTWMLVAIYIRNLLLNWTVVLPLLLAVLMVPRMGAALIDIFPLRTATKEFKTDLAPSWIIYAGYIAGLLGLAWAFGFALRHEPIAVKQIKDRFDNQTANGRKKPVPDAPLKFQEIFLKLCLIPLLLGAIATCVGWRWDDINNEAHLTTFALIFVCVGGVLAILTSIFSYEKRGGYRWWQIIAVMAATVCSGILLLLSATILSSIHDWVVTRFTRECAAAVKGGDTAIYVCLALPMILGSLAGGGILRTGLLSRLESCTDNFREWWSRFGAWMTIASIAWIVLSALVLCGPGLLLYARSPLERAALGGVGGISGLLTILLGKSGKTPATDDAAQSTTRAQRGVQLVLMVAAPVFVCLLVATLSLITDWLLEVRFPIPAIPLIHGWARRFLTGPSVCGTGIAWHFATIEVFGDQPGSSLGLNSACVVFCWLAVLAISGCIASLVINLNRFSLLAAYRNRLVRAYLGASHRDREPDEFTGFDERDNLLMSELASSRDRPLPIHIINMTLNLAGKATRLSWQDRKAASFTVSPYHCGSAQLGYRETKKYGGAAGISLGTAIAISGAAVSPNMGDHTSSVVAFLLTLFNVRLGAWLGNPGKAGDRTYDRSSPRSGALHVVAEAFSLTNDCHKYVYLSDGGHFDNLGLYEMVRRSCRYIVVCDAGEDPDYGFDNLANAIRKIRIDFGIEITFRPSVSIVSSKDKDVAKGKYCARGTIKYTKDQADDGFILYIKTAFYRRNEPIDILGYAGQSQAFPNESTGDQFFTESQFESYRALGEHIVDEIQTGAAGSPARTLDELRKIVEANLPE